MKVFSAVRVRLLPTDDGSPVSFDLLEAPVTLGRDRANEVVLGHESISRTHARFTRVGDDLHIEDLSSSNGTFVNGERVSSSALAHKDLLRLGWREFQLRLGDEPLDTSATAQDHWVPGVHRLSPEDLETEIIDQEALGRTKLPTAAVLGFFHQAGRVLESAFELDDILDGILALTFQIIPAERGFVLLADPDTGEMKVRAEKFRDGARTEPALSTTILEHATHTGEAILTSDALQDDRFSTALSIVDLEIVTAICVPLKGREKILGAIYVDSRTPARRFSPTDLKLLTAVGAQMGIAVHNAHLHAEEVRTQRLAAVGQAVAGLGHCIKNILNGMEGGSFILQQGIDKDRTESIEKGWDILRRNSSRLKDLMLDMLAYSKPREPFYEETDGNHVPREVVDLLQEQARSRGIDLRFEAAADLPPVLLDSKAVYRALLNLVGNALEACPAEGGTVEVRTRSRIDEDRFEIVVRDNGCGIATGDLPRLGKAFFSTKGAQGTGLGLSVTYKVIEEHRGTISVDSQPGQGTTFVVTLPIRRPGLGIGDGDGKGGEA